MSRRCATLLAAGLALVLGLAFPGGGPAAAAEQTVTLGTGAVTGVYKPMGEAIRLLVNRDSGSNGLHIAVETTGGALANLNALRRGRLDLGFAQSDLEFQALNGLEPFAGTGPFRELRSLFSAYTEAFTLVVRNGSGIRDLAGLAGKRVNIGNPGSGTRAMMDLVMDVQGWTKASFAATSELPPEEAGEALCDGRLDAMVYVVGHPNGAILQTVAGCRAVILPVTGPVVERLLTAQPFLVRAAIPGGMYADIPGGMYAETPNEIPTFGVRATLVTTARLPPEVAYTIVKAVFDNLDLFRWLHPALMSLNARQMVQDGNVAPLHEGAARYFREAGLIP